MRARRGGPLARALAAGALLAAAPAGAADEDGTFAIKGAGLQGCAAFVRAWDEGSSDLALYGGWLEGYLTAMNQTTETTHDLAPWQDTRTLLGLLRVACDAAPEGTGVMRAAVDMMRALAPQRMTEASPIERAQADGRAVTFYRETVRRVQARLGELGAADLPETGDLDAPTRAAIEAYQAANGLEPTGLPDQRTLVALFVTGGAAPAE